MKYITAINVLLISAFLSASPLCLYQYSAKKPELWLIYNALNNHVIQKQLSIDHTKKALFKFLDIIDPNHYLLLKSEVKKINQLSNEEVKVLHNETLYTNQRDFYLNLQQQVRVRFDSLIELVAKNKDIRDIVEQKIKEYIDNPSIISKERTPPDSFQEQLSLFVENLAKKAIRYHNSDLNKKYSTREYLVLALRSFRHELHSNAYIYEYENLPLIIAKAYIDSMDAHSKMYIFDENKSLNQGVFQSQFAGLGSNVSMGVEGLKLEEVFSEFGADKAGLKNGDIITHIKLSEEQMKIFPQPFIPKSPWTLIRSLNLNDLLSEVILGTPNTSLEVRVKRDKKVFDVKVFRHIFSKSNVEIKSEVYDSIQGKIGYLKLNSFYQDSADHVYKTIKELKNKKAKALIIDLRSNGGGSVSEFQKMLGFFVKEGPAMNVRNQTGQSSLEITQDSTNKRPLWNKPLIVLVDRFSASASEALSGALKDYGRAIIIGEDSSTFGKGTSQTFPFRGPYVSIKITSNLFSSPGGGHKQFEGVHPDIIIPGVKNEGYSEKDMDNAISPQELNTFNNLKSAGIPGLEQVISTFKNILNSQGENFSSSDQKKLEDKTLKMTIMLMSEWLSMK